MDSYSFYYNSGSKNHPEIEAGDVDVNVEEHKQLQSQDEEELLSLPDGLWDYLMMDEPDQEEQDQARSQDLRAAHRRPQHCRTR